MKWRYEILNTGRLVPLIFLILSLCTPDNISAATRSDGIRVTLLGTGTPFPTPERFGSAILVEADDRRLLFDCGRGAVIRLAQAGVSPRERWTVSFSLIFTPTMLSESRICGCLDGFWAAIDRFQYGALQEFAAW
jgi:hypothetical protein